MNHLLISLTILSLIRLSLILLSHRHYHLRHHRINPTILRICTKTRLKIIHLHLTTSVPVLLHLRHRHNQCLIPHLSNVLDVKMQDVDESLTTLMGMFILHRHGDSRITTFNEMNDRKLDSDETWRNGARPNSQARIIAKAKILLHMMTLTMRHSPSTP